MWVVLSIWALNALLSFCGFPMLLQDYTTLSCLTSLDDALSWSESDVPLERRGVSLEWLVAFLENLQSESQLPRARALQQAEQAYYHNRAANWGMHDQPCMPVPPTPPASLMNVHCFVKEFVKPLTADIHAPLYGETTRKGK
jgi:hypothetical protein